jgi:hypothetical protein
MLGVQNTKLIPTQQGRGKKGKNKTKRNTLNYDSATYWLCGLGQGTK